MATLDEIKQEILSRVDIVDVISQYVQLKRAGRDFKGLSPFTKEKTPSFVVHPNEQFFKCFSTGEAGDIFSFLMKVEGMDFMTAFKTLGKQAGLPIEDMLDRGQKRGPNKDRLYSLLGGLAAHYHTLLLEDPRAEAARAYVSERNLDGDIAERFAIGYAPDAWDTAEQWAKANKYDLKELDLTGMLSHKENDRGERTSSYDRFRDRLMFPIRNETGRVIGFSGRILPGGTAPGKYVNSPETVLFKKSKVLYALDLARKTMVDQRVAMVCEGQIDVIRCHQHGFTNAVAGQGTALTADHARTLKRSADEILLVMDSDAAGVKAALRSGEIFLEHELAVRVATLPSGDPDTLLEAEGKEAFAALLQDAKPFLDFQIDTLSETHDPNTEVGLTRLSQALLETVVRIPSAVRQEQFLTRAGERLGISPDALRSDLDRKVRPKYAQDVARRTAREQQRARQSVPEPGFELPFSHTENEESLLRLLLIHPETRQTAIDYLRPDCVAHPALRATFIALTMEPHLDREPLLSVLASEADCPGGLPERLAVAEPNTGTELGGPLEAVRDVIRRLHIDHLKRLRAELTREYGQSGDLKQQRLWTEIAQITRQLKEFEGKNWEKAADLIRILYGTELEKPTI